MIAEVRYCLWPYGNRNDRRTVLAAIARSRSAFIHIPKTGPKALSFDGQSGRIVISVTAIR